MLVSSNRFPPVIKWSGSKRSVANILSRYIPKGNRYFEPFLGGGALLPFRKIKIGFASDVIPELISLWNMIKADPKKVSFEYRKRWEKLQTEGFEVFYSIRDHFNSTKNEHDFLFLTRTCVNGLIRYNNQGEFNNSFHLTRPGINPHKLDDIIYQWHYVIKDIEFYNCDYRELLAKAKEDDFIFFDPPYGGTKDRYTREKFDIDAFFIELEKLNDKGVKWILTFDGKAGNRNYIYELPINLYTHKIFVKTGHSPFTKMMNTTLDNVNESVYLNFNPSAEISTKVADDVSKESTLFTAVNM